MTDHSHLPYRPNVGVMLANRQGRIFVGQRLDNPDSDAWQMPQGGVEKGEAPRDAALRELKEETGLVASEWTQIMEFHLSNSVTDEYGVAYVAKGLTQEAAEPEDTEDLTLHRLPLSEAIAMTMDGRIKDALSVLALQRVALM